ncbi:MAG: hypothetical protein ACP5TY_07930 [Thermodesulforhabdaceae bacterium]|jgi:hypothetical protein
MRILKFLIIVFVCLSALYIVSAPVSAQVETDGILVNLSTRGYVGTGDNVMIAGFCVNKDPLTVVIRVLGPSLKSQGVYGALGDPVMYIYNSAGNLIGTVDDWITDPSATALRQIGMAPSSPYEPAAIFTANVGCYTIVVMGVRGATGVVLVEVYDISLLL